MSIRLEAIASRLEAIAIIRSEAIGIIRLEAIASRLEAIAIIRSEAIASRVKAIASSLEAIDIRAEAIASRAEAIASRSEAIALRVGSTASKLEAFETSGAPGVLRSFRQRSWSQRWNWLKRTQACFRVALSGIGRFRWMLGAQVQSFEADNNERFFVKSWAWDIILAKALELLHVHLPVTSSHRFTSLEPLLRFLATRHHEHPPAYTCKALRCNKNNHRTSTFSTFFLLGTSTMTGASAPVACVQLYACRSQDQSARGEWDRPPVTLSNTERG